MTIGSSRSSSSFCYRLLYRLRVETSQTNSAYRADGCIYFSIHWIWSLRPRMEDSATSASSNRMSAALRKHLVSDAARWSRCGPCHVVAEGERCSRRCSCRSAGDTLSRHWLLCLGPFFAGCDRTPSDWSSLQSFEVLKRNWSWACHQPSSGQIGRRWHACHTSCPRTAKLSSTYSSSAWCSTSSTCLQTCWRRRRSCAANSFGRIFWSRQRRWNRSNSYSSMSFRLISQAKPAIGASWAC